MERPAQAKYIAPAIHAFLFLAMCALYAGFDQPLLDGPAALPFGILFIADLPFSAVAFGVMFTSASNGPIALALWGVVGTIWWHLLGRYWDSKTHRDRGSSAEQDRTSEPRQLDSAAHHVLLRFGRKTWFVSSGAVSVIVVLALLTSWNGRKGNFQEGAISSFAISPDNHSLLLARTINNNTFLYKISLETGAAFRLTQTRSGIESSPSFSASGKQIAFAYQQSASSPSRIFVVNADGNDLHSLFKTADGNDTAPHFTPHGAQIQFARIAEDITPDPPGPKPWDIYLASLDGPSVIPQTTQHYSTKWGPSFTGDGRHVVYGVGGLSRESLYVISLDKPTNPGDVLAFRIPNGPDSPIYGSPTFVPDGRSIVFLAASQGSKAFDYNVFRFDIATNVLSQLTTNNGYATDLAVSPDGNWAVFLRWTSRWGSLPNLSQMYLLNLNTRAITPLSITGRR